MPPPPPQDGVSEERLARLEAKLDKIADKVDKAETAPSAGLAPAGAGPDSDAKDRRIAELEAEKQALESALAAERASAETTRQELSALKPNTETDTDRLELAEQELEAIVATTEGATETILRRCEELEDQADILKQSAPDPVVEEQADSIREAVTAIYQAANFQDLTGQRVNKVVKTLAFVEDRVAHMKHAWSMTAGETPPGPPEISAEDEAGLLNGPALGDEGLSQDAIDAMFD